MLEVVLVRLNKFIKAYREFNGITQETFAKEVGVTKQYISLLERGRKDIDEDFKPSLDILRNIAKATHMTLDQLLELLEDETIVALAQYPPAIKYRNGLIEVDAYKAEEAEEFELSAAIEKNTVTINVLGSIAAGIPLAAQEDIIGTEEIPFEMAKSGEFFGLRVVGESMAPTIHSGDTVIIKKQSSVEDGEIGVILIDGEDATLKRIHKSNDGLLLTGDNPAVYPPTFYSDRQVENLPVTILGKAVEIRRKL